MGTSFSSSSSALGLNIWSIKSRHELTTSCLIINWRLKLLMLLMVYWCAFWWSRLLAIVPVWSSHLRLHKAILAHTSSTSIIDLNICLWVLLVLFYLVRGSPMYRVFPTLIELWVLTSHVVMQDWRLIHCLERAARMLPMHIIISTWAAHLYHIHNILGVRILLLPQIEHFKFLPHWWVVPSRLNIAERAQRLLRLTIFLSMSKALVLLDLS